MTAIIHRLDVRAANGIPFRVVYVPPGQESLNFPRLAADERDLVEFYDLRHPHTPDGQFVSRYYVDTLMEGRTLDYGLDLDGGIEDWTIDARTMRVVLGWLRSQRLLCHLPAATPTP